MTYNRRGEMEDCNEAQRCSNTWPKHSTRLFWKTYQILLQSRWLGDGHRALINGQITEDVDRRKTLAGAT
jgi:hypothetical protein